MRFLSYLTALLIAALLSSCGGGGGSPGSSSGSHSALSTTAPSALTMQVGLTQQFLIMGGVGPFHVTNSDPAIALGWVSGGNVLTLGTVAAGTAIVTVVDDLNAQVPISVKSGSNIAFYTTAPGAFTIAPGAAAAQTFTVGGGTGPYTATSSNVNVATVELTGTTLKITGVQISSTAATITIRDAANGTLTSTVTVGTVPLAVTPNKATAFIGDIVVATITGGTPPYRASVGIVGTVIASIVGNQLTMELEQLASPAIVTVLDANNQSVAFSLTITIGQDVIRLAPNALSIVETDTQNINLIAHGAVGAIQTFSSNPGLLTATPPATGNVVVVSTGSNGNRCVAADTPVTITVLDSKGSVGTAIITITDNNGGVGC